MKRRTIENSVLAVAAAVALVLTGCQSNAGSSVETEELKEQIARLEQQISELEQRQSASNANTGGSVQPQEDGSAADSQQQKSDTSVGNEQPQENDTSVGNERPQQNDTSVGNEQLQQSDTGIGNEQPPQNNTSAGTGQLPQDDTSVRSGHQSHHSDADFGSGTAALTTYTIEELSAMVEAFAAKAGEAVTSGDAAQDMEQFFAMKQEEKQIDDALDYHEDELEYLYKNGSLTREEYKKLERELKLLEDKLDDAEDQLEYRFGIDD